MKMGLGLYGAIFVKGVPLGSYPFSLPSVSLFDQAAGFFAPTHNRSRWLACAGAFKDGCALAPTEKAGT